MMTPNFWISILILYGIKAQYYCTPNNVSCWPTLTDIETLKHSLKISELIHDKIDPFLYIYSQPKNDLIHHRPSFILVPSSNVNNFSDINLYSDISNSIQFIRKHHLLLTVFSTGHSYPGRSTGEHIGNYSFQINFHKMRHIEMDPHNLTNIIIQPGSVWGSIYKYIDAATNNTRTVIGGGGKSVGPVGYILGGGHSPISAYFGLACDNLISMDIITANMSYIKAQNNGTYNILTNKWNTDNSLFWGLRGVGGSTLGIVTSLTLKTYDTSDIKFIGFSLEYPYYIRSHNNSESYDTIGDGILSHYLNHCIPNFSDKVNAYFYIITIPTIYFNIEHRAVIKFELIYLDNNITNAMNELDCIGNYMLEYQLKKPEYKTYNTYYNWLQNTVKREGNYLNQQFFNGLYNISSLTQQRNNYGYNFVNIVTNFVNTVFDDNNIKTFRYMDGSFTFCFNNMGGKVSQVNSDEMSINPGFRKARLYAWTAGVYLNMSSYMTEMVNQFMYNQSTIFKEFSLGLYLNEATLDDNQWPSDQWGNHYNRLKEIKSEWDPYPSLFNCFHCVTATQ